MIGWLKDTLHWLQDWIALLAPVTGSVVVFWKYWLKKRLDEMKDVYNKIKIMSDEFRPNGGSTLRDAINRIEKKVTIQEQKTLAIIKSLPLGTWISDANGKCVDVNRSLCKIMSRTESEIKGDNWSNWIIPSQKELVFDEWNRCVISDLNFDMEYVYLLPNGKKQKVHGVAYQLRDENQKLMGFLGTLYPIGDPE